MAGLCSHSTVWFYFVLIDCYASLYSRSLVYPIPIPIRFTSSPSFTAVKQHRCLGANYAYEQWAGTVFIVHRVAGVQHTLAAFKRQTRASQRLRPGAVSARPADPAP